jgi:hypothetical protein
VVGASVVVLVVDSSMVVVVVGRSVVVVVERGSVVVVVLGGSVVEVVVDFVVVVVEGFVVLVVDGLVVVVVDGLSSQPCFRMKTLEDGSRTSSLIASLQTCAAQLTYWPWFLAGQHSSWARSSVSANPRRSKGRASLDGTAATKTKARTLATTICIWAPLITRAVRARVVPYQVRGE